MRNNFSKVKKEIAQLSDGKKQLAMNLLNKAQFMETELLKLQASLIEKGWTEEYKNGANQFGVKKSSEGEIYIALTKNYATIMKQLHDILGKTDATADELMTFLKR